MRDTSYFLLVNPLWCRSCFVRKPASARAWHPSDGQSRSRLLSVFIGRVPGAGSALASCPGCLADSERSKSPEKDTTRSEQQTYFLDPARTWDQSPADPEERWRGVLSPQTSGVVGPVNLHRKHNLAHEAPGAPVQAHFTIQLVSDHPPDYARAEAEVCCARPRCAVRGRGVLWSSGSLVLPCTAG
jgi:hypothetical protein